MNQLLGEVNTKPLGHHTGGLSCVYNSLLPSFTTFYINTDWLDISNKYYCEYHHVFLDKHHHVFQVTLICNVFALSIFPLVLPHRLCLMSSLPPGTKPRFGLMMALVQQWLLHNLHLIRLSVSEKKWQNTIFL